MKTTAFVLVTAFLLTAGGAMVMSVPSAYAQATVNVSIKNLAFSPANITVVMGVNNTVTWTNSETDNTNHTVTAADNSFNQMLSPGQTFTHTFSTPGVVHYACTIHPFMKGTVTVIAGPTSATTNSVPAFPFEWIAAIAITTLVLASYFVVRQRKGAELR